MGRHLDSTGKRLLKSDGLRSCDCCGPPAPPTATAAIGILCPCRGDTRKCSGGYIPGGIGGACLAVPAEWLGGLEVDTVEPGDTVYYYTCESETGHPRTLCAYRFIGGLCYRVVGYMVSRVVDGRYTATLPSNVQWLEAQSELSLPNVIDSAHPEWAYRSPSGCNDDRCNVTDAVGVVGVRCDTGAVVDGLYWCDVTGCGMAQIDVPGSLTYLTCASVKQNGPFRSTSGRTRTDVFAAGRTCCTCGQRLETTERTTLCAAFTDNDGTICCIGRDITDATTGEETFPDCSWTFTGGSYLRTGPGSYRYEATVSSTSGPCGTCQPVTISWTETSTDGTVTTGTDTGYACFYVGPSLFPSFPFQEIVGSLCHAAAIGTPGVTCSQHYTCGGYTASVSSAGDGGTESASAGFTFSANPASPCSGGCNTVPTAPTTSSMLEMLP